MNFHRLATAVLAALLLAQGSLAADKPQDSKGKRVDAYPGSLKLPSFGLKSGSSKMGSSLSSSASQERPATRVAPSAETQETPQIPSSRQSRPARNTADQQPAPKIIPDPAGNLPAQTAQPAKEAKSVVKASARPATAPRANVPTLAEPEENEVSSVENEFLEPIKASQLSDQVRHGPVRRAGLTAEMLEPARSAPSVEASEPEPAPAPSRVAHASQPDLKLGFISADDFSSEQPGRVRSSGSRGVAATAESETLPVSDAASPARLLQSVQSVGGKVDLEITVEPEARPIRTATPPKPNVTRKPPTR